MVEAQDRTRRTQRGARIAERVILLSISNWSWLAMFPLYLLATALMLLAVLTGRWFLPPDLIPVDASSRSTTGIYLVDLRTRLAVSVLRTVGWPGDPVLSPDRSQLAFSGRQDSGAGIFISSWTGQAISAVAVHAVTSAFPAWSPNGRQIAFVLGESNTDIYLIETAGGSPRRLTDTPGGESTPDWSPDGRFIAFVSASGFDPADIYISAADCLAPCPDSPVQFTGQPGFDLFPAWSPDGRFIAFLSDRGGARGIYLLGTDCLAAGDCHRRNALPLVSGSLLLRRLTWSPDGHLLFFLVDSGERPRLMALDPACGATGLPCLPVPVVTIR